MAYSRQRARVGHPAQTAFAGAAVWPFSGNHVTSGRSRHNPSAIHAGRRSRSASDGSARASASSATQALGGLTPLSQDTESGAQSRGPRNLRPPFSLPRRYVESGSRGRATPGYPVSQAPRLRPSERRKPPTKARRGLPVSRAADPRWPEYQPDVKRLRTTGAQEEPRGASRPRSRSATTPVQVPGEHPCRGRDLATGS